MHVSVFYISKANSLSWDKELASIWQQGNTSIVDPDLKSRIKDGLRSWRMLLLGQELKQIEEMFRQDTALFPYDKRYGEYFNRNYRPTPIEGLSWDKYLIHLQQKGFTYSTHFLKDCEPFDKETWYDFSFTALSSLEWVRGVSHGMFITDNIAPHQHYKCYNAHLLDLAIEKQFREELDTIRSFCKDLREVLEVLAIPANHVLGDSGQEEIIYKKGSHADKQREIANRFSSNPDYTAYVRLRGGAIQYCWSCGKKPVAFDKVCQDCQKDLKHEYTVSVAPVQKDEAVSVDAIIAEIVKRNVADGYLRLRSDVEREIRERQQPDEQKTAAR